VRWLRCRLRELRCNVLRRSAPTFSDWVDVATRGTRPYPYQSGLAEHGLPDVLRVPTGTGKTLAATLPWLYRRLEHPDPVVRQTTPHWLVVVLPQRALVEQTVWVIEGWLRNLRLGIPVHVLMGGEDTGDRDWKTYPEPERIFVGTLDMVLSRLLMRGFAEGRSTWPMSFGLLHAGVQFVFDEVQLMGPGLPTSLQLQGLREELGTAVPCRSIGCRRPWTRPSCALWTSGGSAPSWNSVTTTGTDRSASPSWRPALCDGLTSATSKAAGTRALSPSESPLNIDPGRAPSWCSTPWSGRPRSSTSWLAVLDRSASSSAPRDR
jgi:hypothetical protein